LKNVLYYHLYMTDDYGTWSSIFMEHMKLLEDHKVLDILDKIEFTVITQNNQSKINAFVDLQAQYDIGKPKNIDFIINPYNNDKDMLNAIETPTTATENITMRKIWNHSQTEDMRILYLHSKGITSTLKHLEMAEWGATTFKTYYYWRQFLNWGVIENWRKCVESLRIGDIAGVNFYNAPSKHFSGNYWWANSNYIKRLPDPSTTDWWINIKNKSSDPWLKSAGDRFRDEQWPCSLDDARIYNVYSPDQNDNPAGKVFPRILYEDKA